MLLIRYSVGLDSERAIAWRVADSMNVAGLSGIRTGGSSDGSHALVADAATDRCGNAPARVHLDAGAIGGGLGDGSSGGDGAMGRSGRSKDDGGDAEDGPEGKLLQSGPESR